MSDKPSMFPQLGRPAVPATPPPFQFALDAIAVEYRRISELLASSRTVEELQEKLGSIEEASQQLSNATSMAVAERVARIGEIHGSLLAETFAAVLTRIEVQFFLLTISINPVMVAPVVAAALAEEVDDEDDEEK